MNIIIRRTMTHGEYTHGTLSIDGTKICHTLENSNALLPAGVYPISLIKCKHHARKMPCLNPSTPCDRCSKSLNSHCNATLSKRDPSSLNFVLPCYCPMLKPGNGVHNRLDGSILIGRYNCLGSLVHPKDFFDSLFERIRKSLSRGNEILLTINDPSPLTSHP